MLPSAFWATTALLPVSLSRQRGTVLIRQGTALRRLWKNCMMHCRKMLSDVDTTGLKLKSNLKSLCCSSQPFIPSQAIALQAIISCLVSWEVFEAHTPHLACSSKRKTQHPLALFPCLAPFLSHYCSIFWYCSLIWDSSLASLWGFWLLLPVSWVRVLISAALGRISLRRVSGASLKIWPSFVSQILFFPGVNRKPRNLCVLVSIQADKVLEGIS